MNLQVVPSSPPRPLPCINRRKYAPSFTPLYKSINSGSCQGNCMCLLPETACASYNGFRAPNTIVAAQYIRAVTVVNSATSFFEKLHRSKLVSNYYVPRRILKSSCLNSSFAFSRAHCDNCYLMYLNTHANCPNVIQLNPTLCKFYCEVRQGSLCFLTTVA